MNVGRPDFEDSIIGDNDASDDGGEIVGFLQESDGGAGFLMASGAPQEAISIGESSPDEQ